MDTDPDTLNNRTSSVVLTGKPPTIKSLQRIAEKMEAERQSTNREIASWIHHAAEPDETTLEVVVDGYPYLSIRIEGQALVVDTHAFERALTGATLAR